MGTKTTVNNKGVFSETVAGSAISFIVDGKTINKVENGALNGDVTAANKPVIVMEATATAVTGVLPAVSTDNIGLQYTFVYADNTSTLALSGTNKINGGVWELDVTASMRAITVIAVSSSKNGFSWEQMGHVH